MTLLFAWPLALIMLVSLPVLGWWLVRGPMRPPALSMSSLAGVQDANATLRVRLRWLPLALRLAAVGLLIVAVARPQSGQAENLLPQEGIDIVLVLDTSTSMRQPVLDGVSRLQVAQDVLRDFIAERQTDRLGLVVFRSRSLVMSPLTVDYGVFQSLVEEAGDLDLPNGTAIGLALTDAVSLLRDSKAESRIIILLSDGENNRPEVEPLEAARIAQVLGVRIYTIGVTSARGSGLPEGVDILPFRVNESTLRTMADLTGGRYFQADTEALAEVYENIDALERSRLGPERFSSVDELAPYAIGLALALILLEVALASTVLRRMP